MNQHINEVNELLNKNSFTNKEKDYFWNVISPIFYHPEFQKRLDNKLYPHHGTISLGNHLIYDAIITYKLMLKAKTKRPDLDIKLAIIIAMFHDLYELPWQNSSIKKSKFINKHGFVHSIEAIINSIIWFPSYFENIDDAKIIIDGVLHHMWPFPVRAIENNLNNIELNNFEKINLIPENLQTLIITSSCRTRFYHISFSKSRFKEGKIMSKADKIVSYHHDLTSINSLKAIITGKNPDLHN